MNKITILNNKTDGRDKLARLIQYTSKLTWHLLQQYNGNGKSVDRLKELEYILANFRRLLRWGRCMDSLYNAMCLIKNEDALVSVNIALSKVSMSVYLLCDHIIWLGRCGFADVNINRWNRISSKYWLLSIILNLIRDYIEVKRLLSQNKNLCQFHYDPKVFLNNFKLLYGEHKDLVLDIIKNGCDLFLPLTSLNYVELNSGMIGFFGVVSSIAGIYSLIDPYAKLPLA